MKTRAGSCRVSFVLALGSAIAPHANAQCTGQWTGAGLPGVDGEVLASTLWDPDGAGPQPPVLVVGGDFRIAGSAISPKIAAWNGASWSALGPGLPNKVTALGVHQGQLIAAVTSPSAATAVYAWTGSAWQQRGETGVGSIDALERALRAARSPPPKA